MTADELRMHFYETFGLTQEWPASYEVDAETYGHVAHAIITRYLDHGHGEFLSAIPVGRICLRIGINGGLMFKGVELIIRSG